MAAHPDWAIDVLHFWFQQLEPAQWFQRSDDVDHAIIARFLDLHGVVHACPDATILLDATTARAAIIVLDQFSRNMFRNDPRAFAGDQKALVLAEAAIVLKYDEAKTPAERLFLYLPFEHAETLSAQSRSVALISGLGVEAYTKSAVAHQAIITRFGRYPHRNAVLGRASSEEELAFLKEAGSSF